MLNSVIGQVLRGGGNDTSTELLDQLLAAGDPATPVQWIDIRDLAEWAIRMAEAGETGVYNAVGPAEAMTWGGLLDALGIAKAHVCGLSMGGYVLLNLAERYPQRMAAAMFLVTRASADDEPGRMRRTTLAHEVASGRPQIVTDAFAQILFAADTPGDRPELVAGVREWMTATAPQGLVGGLLAMRDRKDYVDSRPSFGLPALVIGAALLIGATLVNAAPALRPADDGRT